MICMYGVVVCYDIYSQTNRRKIYVPCRSPKSIYLPSSGPKYIFLLIIIDPLDKILVLN